LRDQAALDQAGDDQASLDPTPDGALPAVCPLTPTGSAPSSAPPSPQSPLPGGSDRDSFPQSPATLSPAMSAPSVATFMAPAAAVVSATHPLPHAEGSAEGVPAGSVAAPPCDGRPVGRPLTARANPAPAWPDARYGSRMPRPAGRRPRRAADPVAWVRGAEAVGWRANSAPGRAGLSMPILLRYRNTTPAESPVP
jgi:hypothetical protein